MPQLLLELPFKGQYPVPTYIAEFLLGRYCSSTDDKEIEEGIQVVQHQLADRTVRPGEEEFFKSKVRETGAIRIIDIITARLYAKTDSYIVPGVEGDPIAPVVGLLRRWVSECWTSTWTWSNAGSCGR
jgi:predicted ATP-dependent Lon-type protease